MFEKIINFFKKIKKAEEKTGKSKDAAKERLHLVLMQDRANISADFLELMKQEIIDVIKKYIDIDENAIDVRLTNKTNEDGTNGAPALYANIPITNIKDDVSVFAKIQKHQDISKSMKSENNDVDTESVASQSEAGANVNVGENAFANSIHEASSKEEEVEKDTQEDKELEIEKKNEALEEIKEAEEIKEKVEIEIEEEKKEEVEVKKEEKREEDNNTEA